MAQVRTTASVIVRDLGWKRIKANARGLDGRGVNAGILARGRGQRDDRDWSGNPIPAWRVLLITRFGTSTGPQTMPIAPVYATHLRHEQPPRSGGVVRTAQRMLVLVWQGLRLTRCMHLGEWYVTAFERRSATARALG